MCNGDSGPLMVVRPHAAIVIATLQAGATMAVDDILII